MKLAYKTLQLLNNGEPVTKIDYLKDLGSEEKTLEFLKQEMEYGDSGRVCSIDDNDFKKALGLEIDDDGNKTYTNCSAYGDKGNIAKGF